MAFLLALSVSQAAAADFADMVRELNVLQNRMAMGDAVARDKAAKQFDAIEAAIDKVEPDGWSDARTLRAAVVYLLCGGAPAKLRDIRDAGFAAASLDPLLDASLRYAEGESEAAAKALAAFDPRQFAPILGGHLALVKGSAAIGVDNARAVSMLDLARLLMPASLVEEAALRREIALLDPAVDHEKLALLAARYAQIYGASPYAGDFWTQLHELTRSSEADTTSLAKAFEPVMSNAPATERVRLFLTLAGRRVRAGQLSEAAEQLSVAEKSAATARDKMRVAAYRAALSSLSGDSDRRALEKLGSADLDADDREIVTLAASVAERLAKTRTQEPAPPPETPLESRPIVAAARAALERSEALLKRASQR